MSLSVKRGTPYSSATHVVVACLVLALTACGDPKTDSSSAAASRVDVPIVGHTDYQAQEFTDADTVDNPWLPLVPGMRFVYDGKITEDGVRADHRVVFTVTDATKVIDGVRTRAIIDEDYLDGELLEYELAFFAQDDDGNVWLMGEYPEEYEDGEFVGAPDTWLAGVAGAQPGVMMRAQPAEGTSAYYQGIWEAIEFKDRAEVIQTDGHTCTPLECHQNVLVTREGNPDEPGAFQLKYYARGIGNVRVGWAGPKEKEREVLALTRLEDLGPEEMQALRAEVLKLERRAYEVSKVVYGDTAPIQGG
jgi:hypothetical protein